MKVFLIALLLIAASHPASAKMDQRAEASLRSLDPKTRLEQVCDVEAMERINDDKSNNHEPDRAIGEATLPTVLTGDTLEAKGGAVRSHGHWYHLSYTCTGSQDHLKVKDFTYSIGERIPPSEWEQDNLWN